MFKQQRDRGEVPTAAVALLSLVLGAGAAAAAISAVVGSSAPNDSSAVKSGPTQILPADQVITYGG